MRKNSRTSAGSQISLRERIVDNLELPKDLMLGAAIVTVTGRGEAVISNYKGILEYEDTLIQKVYRFSHGFKFQIRIFRFPHRFKNRSGAYPVSFT